MPPFGLADDGLAGQLLQLLREFIREETAQLVIRP